VVHPRRLEDVQRRLNALTGQCEKPGPTFQKGTVMLVRWVVASEQGPIAYFQSEREAREVASVLDMTAGTVTVLREELNTWEMRP
jgi:hypothetical protein